MDDVLQRGSLPVPSHLRSATWREKRDFGTGRGYIFPHDYEGADVEQQYLPDELVGRRYYEPSDHGYERTIGERMAARRAARDADAECGGPMPERGVKGKVNAMKVVRWSAAAARGRSGASSPSARSGRRRASSV